MKLKICIKCNKDFPQFITIEGKKKNLQNRKYCLDCSPFGQHNTTKIPLTLDYLLPYIVECSSRLRVKTLSRFFYAFFLSAPSQKSFQNTSLYKHIHFKFPSNLQVKLNSSLMQNI